MYSYVARQPILNIEQEVVAYELLFRDGVSNCFPDVNPDQATSNILTNNHLTMGLEQITGQCQAYVNFHAKALLQKFPSFLDPKKVVIEILEDVTVCDKLLAACKQLKAKGYVLALDDHDFDPKWEVFFPYVDIIKIDVLDHSIIEISRLARQLTEHNVALLAEKVETLQQFEQLKLLGFTLFQGYFFSKPEVVKQKKISTSKHSILELLSETNKASFDLEKVNDIFSCDPGLTYKLLRFMNSPTYGTSQEITSLKHALIYLGDLELKKFIALLALADLNQGKPSEMMRISLFRAKFCELVSQHKKDNENPPKAFLTGLLSLIDGILDHQLNDVLEMLPIHSDIKAALLSKENYLANYLALAQEYELGQWQQCADKAEQLELDEGLCNDINQQALSWADDLLLNKQ